MSIPKPIFIIITCFVLVLIFGGGLIWPEYQQLKNINNDINIREGKFNSNEMYFSNLAKISAELDKHKEEISKINSALPEDPSVPSFLNFLQETCSQAGMLLDSIGPVSVSSPEDGIKEISLSLQVQGSYSSFKNFLSILEKSSRLIETENISFSASRDAESPLSFKLTIRTHSH